MKPRLLQPKNKHYTEKKSDRRNPSLPGHIRKIGKVKPHHYDTDILTPSSQKESGWRGVFPLQNQKGIWAYSLKKLAFCISELVRKRTLIQEFFPRPSIFQFLLRLCLSFKKLNENQFCILVGTQFSSSCTSFQNNAEKYETIKCLW